MPEVKISTMKEVFEFVEDQVIRTTAAIAREKGIDLNPDVMTARMADTAPEWFEKIILNACKTIKEADLLDGLPAQRVDPLVKLAFITSIQHDCIEYAHILLGE